MLPLSPKTSVTLIGLHEAAADMRHFLSFFPENIDVDNIFTVR
jgi:hypothetical protein